MQAMTHDDYMRALEDVTLELEKLGAKRLELQLHSEYIPGPVLMRRHRELDAQHNQLDAQLRELVDLDRAGAVS